MTEITKIEMSEKDIKNLVAEKFNLDPDRCKITFSHYPGDARDSGYTNAVVEGPKHQSVGSARSLSIMSK